MMLHRAGLWTEEQMLNRVGEVIGGIENAPGSRLMSPEESSLVAPLIDGSVSSQRVDLQNTAISYYQKGETIGIVLDLLIRGRTRGAKSLDDVMRAMYRRFYLESPNATYYLRGRGYTGEDFERVATEVAGFDLHDFFERHVRRAETPPYDEALAFAGLRLVRTTALEPFNAGISVSWGETEAATIGSVRHNSPAEEAGLSQGDVLLSIGTEKVTRNNWREVLGRFKQGQRVPVTVKRDRRTIQTGITLGAPDRFQYRVEERGDATAQMRALRAAWLRGK
ncbi:MAG TPA: PDZ domain-containing protein, partial [Pyrinomonadaceae bacterium]